MIIQKTYQVFLKLFAFSLLLISSINSFSQTYNFQFFSVQEGLPQSTVNAIFQDSRGFLWIGTAGGGICKFDGEKFTQYSSKDGISGDIVTDITEDKEQNIWFTSSWGGITKYNGRKFTVYNENSKKEKIGGAKVIFCDSKGNLWLSNEGKIDIYKNEVFNPISKLLQKKIKGYVTEIIEDSKNNILITTTSGGIIYINKTDTLEINTDFGLPTNNITAIHEDINGDFIIGTHQGGVIKLFKGSIDNKKQFEFQPLQIEKEVIVTAITTDRDKNIVIATANKGIYFVNPENFVNRAKKENGLLTNSLSAIYKDKSGNLWIGTNGFGLCKLGNTAFSYFENITGLNYANIFGVFIENNDIWVSTGDEGIFKYDGEHLTNYTTKNGLGGDEVRAIIKDKNNAFWFATNSGLTKYQNNKFTNYTTKNGLPSDKIRALMLDSKNNLWIGTLGGGLSLMKDGHFTNYGLKEGLINLNVHSLFEDNKGTIWVGTGNGIHKLMNNKITNYSTNKGICNSYIGSITQDHVGNIWFGTDRGVVKYDGIDFKSMTTENGLSSNTIYFIHNDFNKNIWVGTNNGVDKISLNSYGQIEKIKNYGINEGFKGIECNSRAVFQDNKSNIWFGTIKGLIKYNPREDRSNVFQPVVSIDNIKLFLEDVNWSKYSNHFEQWSILPQELVIDYNENHLTFEYSALSLTNPENVQYSFKLEPFDKDWFKDTKKTSATYSNLPPGDYTFYLKARNNDGIWTNEPTTFSFTIKTPFWQTWWFYLSFLIGLIYLLFKISSIKERRQLKISSDLERKVRERTIQIEQQRDEKEILLKEIHHRVKNNLQVINSLLSLQSNYTNDKSSIALFDEAKNRIRSMALIHEKMYQSGDLAHIDFQDYLERLTNDLIATYSINCDILLDIKIDPVKFSIDTIIPLGLLINEIISNTLKYAFVNRTEGVIKIRLSKLDINKYVLILGDNGKGMPKEIFDSESSTLGIELIKVFTEQLDGEINLLDTEGTNFEIVFTKKID